MINKIPLQSLKDCIEYTVPATKDDIKLIEKQIRYLDNKIDILRSEINIGMNRLNYWVIGSFLILFIMMFYLITIN